MRAWPLHVVFATILVGSLAARERVADALVDVDSSSREAAVVGVAQSHGLALQGDTTVPGTNLTALAFEAPGCSGPILVVSRITFDYEPLLQFNREEGDVLRYVYIDRSWEKPYRLAAFAERMRYAALATFGLTRYLPSAYLLLVDSPSGCRAADGIDWRNVWSRDHLAAGETESAPK